MQRETMDAQEMRVLSDDLRKTGTYFMLGTNTIWVPSTQTKIIDVSVAVMWPDTNGEIVPMPPGEVARVELQREYPDLKRVGWYRGQVKQFDWRPPLYCDPVGEGEFVQVDLSGAYWQIYRYLWVNTPFPMGYGTLPLYNVAERLKDQKGARNALVGICRARKSVAFKGGNRIEVTTGNAFLSPGLWATIQAVLNEIASLAVTLGAVYVATDGYIFPLSSPGLSTFCAWLEDNEFAYRRVIQGPGEVAGWCCYKVGDRKTHLYKIGARPYGKLDAVKKFSGGFSDYLARCRRRHRGLVTRARMGNGGGVCLGDRPRRSEALRGQHTGDGKDKPIQLGIFDHNGVD